MILRRSDVRCNIKRGGAVRRQLGGVHPTGTDECAGDAAADAVASVVQMDDPAGSIQEKGENECR